MYAGGLAVECLMRAFVGLQTLEFDQKHDLRRLFNASSFKDMLLESEIVEVQGSLDRVVTRWRNSIRFLSERTMRRVLKNEGLDRRIKGDFLKENCRILVVAAGFLVDKGRQKWKSL
jgi:hypothetical protein